MARGEGAGGAGYDAIAIAIAPAGGAREADGVEARECVRRAAARVPHVIVAAVLMAALCAIGRDAAREFEGAATEIKTEFETEFGTETARGNALQLAAVGAGAPRTTVKSETPACAGWDAALGPPPCFGNDVIAGVRRALQDENCAAARSSPKSREDVGTKLLKIKDETPFVFFRGSAGLFFQNFHCLDPNEFQNSGDVPHVISSGDAHPENFGTLELANGKLTWGVNDFDHAFRSPFYLDVTRGATGFVIACMEHEGVPKSACIKSAQKWAEGYVSLFRGKACMNLTNADRFVEGSDAVATQPGGRLIKAVFEKARKRDTEKKLRKWIEKYVDVSKERFLSTEKLLPLNKSEHARFELAIESYLFNGVPALAKYPDPSFFKLIDVAEKKGSGTGSIGLKRYYLLMKGRTTKFDFDHLILEMKEVVESVLEKYEEYDVPAILEGKRALEGGRAAYPFANVFHGYLNADDRSYIIRRKNPYKKSVSVEDLGANEFLDFAYAAGRAQAMYHALIGCSDYECAPSSKTTVDEEACSAVSAYLARNPNFVPDVVRFAMKEAVREKSQHAALRTEFESNEALKNDPTLFLNSS